MKRPQNGAMLDWWERARTHAPLERAVQLLSLFVDATADAIADWPIGRRDRALLAARSILIGPEIRTTAVCPKCGAEIEAAFDVDAVTVADPPAAEAVLADGVRLRAVTSRDLARALASPEPRLALAQSCVVAGAPGQWNETLVEQVAVALQLLDPQADIRLRLNCTECATEWSAPLFVESFVWRELSAWVRARFDEVDRLARVYGWSEGEILALPPQRRRIYLELAAS